jgi:isopentenyl diphosphate isomerase/L-lactate dehydrogenase-like FMN-dependent dehydrogenase
VATIGGLEDGVKTYIDQIRTELISAMVLTGCRDLMAVGRHILRPQAPKF